MKRNYLILMFFILAFVACIQSPTTNKSKTANTGETLFIPFNSMTLNYMGKSKTNNQQGKILFEKERLIMQGGNSKEAFFIQKISEADNIIVFQTKNNKNEESTFYFEFLNNNISKVRMNMFGMEGYLNISNGNVDYSKLIAFFKESISDCNCNLINRADGAIIKSCDPLPVSSDKDIEIGLSLMSNSSIIYGAISLRFANKIESLKNEINIILESGYHIKSSIISQQKTIIGNSEVQLAIYNLSENDIKSLKNSEISIISFELNDQYVRSFEAHTNKDVFIKHYNCLIK